MSETDPPRAPYLRRVTFLDTAPDQGTDPPVHVAHKLLLDGVEHSQVMARDGWQVFADEFGGATIVSFVAFAEHITLKTYPRKADTVDRPEYAGGGENLLSGTHLCGLPVLTPSDYPWERLAVADGTPALVRVFFFAREVEILAAKQPAEVPA